MAINSSQVARAVGVACGRLCVSFQFVIADNGVGTRITGEQARCLKTAESSGWRLRLIAAPHEHRILTNAPHPSLLALEFVSGRCFGSDTERSRAQVVRPACVPSYR